MTLSTLQHTAIFPWEPVTILGTFRIIELFLHTRNQQTPPKTLRDGATRNPVTRRFHGSPKENNAFQRHNDAIGHKQHISKVAQKRQRVLPFLLCFHLALISINERSLGIPANVSESMFWPVLAFRRQALCREDC